MFLIGYQRKCSLAWIIYGRLSKELWTVEGHHDNIHVGSCGSFCLLPDCNLNDCNNNNSKQMLEYCQWNRYLSTFRNIENRGFSTASTQNRHTSTSSTQHVNLLLKVARTGTQVLPVLRISVTRDLINIDLTGIFSIQRIVSFLLWSSL